VVSAGQVPEIRMFPLESVVVLNTVLSAAALARDLGLNRYASAVRLPEKSPEKNINKLRQSTTSSTWGAATSRPPITNSGPFGDPPT
jgi:hypothetical protein